MMELKFKQWILAGIVRHSESLAADFDERAGRVKTTVEVQMCRDIYAVRTQELQYEVFSLSRKSITIELMTSIPNPKSQILFSLIVDIAENLQGLVWSRHIALHRWDTNVAARK